MDHQIGGIVSEEKRSSGILYMIATEKKPVELGTGETKLGRDLKRRSEPYQMAAEVKTFDVSDKTRSHLGKVISKS